LKEHKLPPVPRLLLQAGERPPHLERYDVFKVRNGNRASLDKSLSGSIGAYEKVHIIRIKDGAK